MTSTLREVPSARLDPEATTPLFGRICGASTLLPPYGQSSVVEQDRKRLVRYPLRYESSNSTFFKRYSVPHVSG